MALEATLSVPWLKMPPPATAELSLTLVSVTVVAPSSALPRPPPLRVAWLLLTMQLVRLAVPTKGPVKVKPLVNRPPPLTAVLPVIRVLVAVVVPRPVVNRPPPSLVAELPLTVQLDRMVAPSLVKAYP